MEVEMTMSPLQHAPLWEVLSTQPVVTSSDILLREVAADAVPSSLPTIFVPAILLCLAVFKEEEEVEEELETETEAGMTITG